MIFDFWSLNMYCKWQSDNCIPEHCIICDKRAQPEQNVALQCDENQIVRKTAEIPHRSLDNQKKNNYPQHGKLRLTRSAGECWSIPQKIRLLQTSVDCVRAIIFGLKKLPCSILESKHRRGSRCPVGSDKMRKILLGTIGVSVQSWWFCLGFVFWRARCWQSFESVGVVNDLRLFEREFAETDFRIS